MSGSMPGNRPVAHSRLSFYEESRVTSLDWVTYPILRFKDAPKVATVVIQRTDQANLRSWRGAATSGPRLGARKRVLRCNGCADAYCTVHAGTRARGAEGSGVV